VQQRSKEISDVGDLKQQLMMIRRWLQRTLIDEAASECCKRLQACVRARGRRFEHLIWLLAHLADRWTEVVIVQGDHKPGKPGILSDFSERRKLIESQGILCNLRENWLCTLGAACVKQSICSQVYVCNPRAGVQSTLDPYAEAFIAGPLR